MTTRRSLILLAQPARAARGCREAAKAGGGQVIVATGPSDLRTRLLGGALWCACFYYSASPCALRALAEWLHDQNNPPGGTA